MTIARILVPVRGDGKGQDVIAHAAALAKRFAAHVECVHCRARAEDFMPFGVNIPRVLREQIRQSAETLAQGEEDRLRALFEGLLPELGLTQSEDGRPIPGTASASFDEAEGKMAEIIRIRGKLADLTFVARPDRDRNLGENSLRAGLFQTGRPVVMCPPAAPPADFAAHVAIAWNGALEATRAVALAQPVLRAADKVTVLDGGAEDERVSGMALIDYLTTHGVEATRTEIDAKRDPGGVILASAKAAGATLLVTGAYGHSREHETLFGGATRTMVDKSDMAVLMAH
ncbi:MAG: universal stress protein [Pseudomonadota bacterium]